MQNRDFKKLLEHQWHADNFVCVGLDSDKDKMPRHIREQHPNTAIQVFNQEIIQATKDIVCAYKINSAFYESDGAEGHTNLKEIIEYIHENAPTVPVILDAKRADIDNTNTHYAIWAFDRLKADAITVHPYMGKEAMEPFLKRKDKGIFILCRTSNKGSDEFQTLPVNNEPLYRTIARHITETWNENNNCGIVAGATNPNDLKNIRKTVGTMPILIPGIGAQGGDLKQAVTAGRDTNGKGMILTSSRGILYASQTENFAEAARHCTKTLRDQIISHNLTK